MLRSTWKTKTLSVSGSISIIGRGCCAGKSDSASIDKLFTQYLVRSLHGMSAHATIWFPRLVDIFVLSIKFAHLSAERTFDLIFDWLIVASSGFHAPSGRLRPAILLTKALMTSIVSRWAEGTLLRWNGGSAARTVLTVHVCLTKVNHLPDKSDKIILT